MPDCESSYVYRMPIDGAYREVFRADRGDGCWVLTFTEPGAERFYLPDAATPTRSILAGLRADANDLDHVPREPDAAGFVECDACADKPGHPTLCRSCLINRNALHAARKDREQLETARHDLATMTAMVAAMSGKSRDMLLARAKSWTAGDCSFEHGPTAALIWDLINELEKSE